MPPTFFTPETLKFLRGLARHNDREWFEPRRERYERFLKEPLLQLIGAVNEGIARDAPQHIRPPNKTAMRLYRDTRFSPDKRPYKTHVAAWWAERGTERTTGAGFYFHLSATEVIVAAGSFMPSGPQLLAVRRWLQANHELYRKLVRKSIGPHTGFAEADGLALKRVPRGFAAEDAAADVLRQTRWGVHLSLPAEAALAVDFAPQLISRFRAASPLVRALSQALRQEPEPSRSEDWGSAAML